MANEFNVVQWIADEGLRHLTNPLKCAKYFDTSWNKELQKPFPVGATFDVPKPRRFDIVRGLLFQPQDIQSPKTTVRVEEPFGVHLQRDSVEAALYMERGREAWSENVLKPAMNTVAQAIDSAAALFATINCPNVVGALGTNPSSTDVFGHARQLLVEGGCPEDGEKICIIPPAVQRTMTGAVQSFFNPVDTVTKAFKTGVIGRAQDFDWYESMSLYDQTAGVWAGTVEMSTGSQSGASITLTATNGDTFLAGNKFSIAGVYKVNPMTRRRTNSSDLAMFTILEDVTAAASAATLSIYPAIVGPGSPYQNVDALPANGADLTLYPGTTSPSTGPKTGKMGIVMHQSAFMLVGVPLEIPKNAVEESAMRRDPQTGIAVAYIKDWNNQHRRFEYRLETMIGFGVGHADAASCLIACG